VEREALLRKAKVFFGSILFSFIVLTIPSLAFADTYYTVKPGDTLWKISRTYNTTVEQIDALNSLDSSLIYPGQSLLVAKNSDTDGGSFQATEVSRGTSRVGEILNYAKSFIGVPYRYGGVSPRGFDCSGYVQYVFGNFGIDLPRTADEQYGYGKSVSSEEAKPGDIVAFRTGGAISHTGIYLGGGKFISSTSSDGVMITSVYGPYWGDHFYGFSRIIP
jgi:peptidoglycan endopeptidase LytE